MSKQPLTPNIILPGCRKIAEFMGSTVYRQETHTGISPFFLKDGITHNSMIVGTIESTESLDTCWLKAMSLYGRYHYSMDHLLPVWQKIISLDRKMGFKPVYEKWHAAIDKGDVEQLFLIILDAIDFVTE